VIAEHGETEWKPEKYLAIDYVPECVGNGKALRAEAGATSSSARNPATPVVVAYSEAASAACAVPE
jgi:hypothetical protein